ncbi:MAG: SurA N-terminal domain-containing protein [Pseudomonadota bacterium]
MLDSIRRGTKSWMAMGLFFLLILSFAVWGIADQIPGFAPGAVASVGDREISQRAFSTAYQSQIAQVSQRVGRRLTRQEAQQIYPLLRQQPGVTLEGDVLSRLLGRAAIDQHAQALSLGLSDDAVANGIRNNPLFRGINGSFDRQRFAGVLLNAGMTEEGYVIEQRRGSIREQLTTSLATAITPPPAMVDLLHKFQNETRTIRYFVLDPKVAGKIKPPTDKALKAHYEANKRQFMQPELRQVDLVVLNLPAALKLTPVTDKQIADAYARTKSRYDKPEEREVWQLSFRDAKKAAQAQKMLKDGKSFEEIAKAFDIAATDYKLGTVKQADMIDAAIAKAAFALKKDKTSGLVKGRFSSAILRVATIKPGKPSTLKEATPQVRALLQRERAQETIQAMHDKIDAARGDGKSMAEVAKAFKLELQAVTVDAQGRDADGKPKLEGNDAAAIARAIFAGDVGVESDIVELRDGGYAWFDVLKVTPTKQKTYEQVAKDVKAIVTDLETRRAIRKVATELVKKINGGETLEAIAKARKLKIETSKALKRQDNVAGAIPAATVRRAFSIPQGEAATTPSAGDKSRMIFEVAEVKPAGKITDQERTTLVRLLSNQMRDDTITTYVAALLEKYGQSVNEREVRRATGEDVSTPGGRGSF